VTGNTGIDAVLHVRNTLDSGALPATEWPQLNPRRRLIVVTSHRRENFGPGFGERWLALPAGPMWRSCIPFTEILASWPCPMND
jgi:hypothetical protein